MQDVLTADQEEALTEIFRDILGVPDLILRDEMTAADVSTWDSFNHINIVLAVEENFGLRFSKKEIAALANIGEFKTLIATKLKM